MRKFKYLVLPAAVLLVLAGCRQTPETAPARVGAGFTTSIGTYATRAADDHWEAGDEVGVYMMPAGVPLSENALALNRRYITTGTSALGAATAADEIFYPDNGAAVDFVAYYPWRETITDFTYPVNVATQNPFAAIDLLWSDNARGFHKGDPTAAMSFTHRLSKIVLRIADDSERVADPAVTIEGIATTAEFSLVDGSLSNIADPADVSMIVSAAGDHSFAAEAIVIPADGVEFTLLFTIGDKIYRKPVTVDLVAGKKYIYNVTVTDKLYMEGEGDIVDWDEQPGEDLEFDVKEMVQLPWNGDLSPVSMVAWLAPGIGQMPLYPGMGFDPRWDGPDFWRGNHAVWDCEVDDDDILHLDFQAQMEAQFPQARRPVVFIDLDTLLHADGEFADDVNQPILSGNEGNITVDRNNDDPDGDNAGTFMIIRARFSADGVDVPIIRFYCIEIRDTPRQEP